MKVETPTETVARRAAQRPGSAQRGHVQRLGYTRTSAYEGNVPRWMQPSSKSARGIRLHNAKAARAHNRFSIGPQHLAFHLTCSAEIDSFHEFRCEKRSQFLTHRSGTSTRLATKPLFSRIEMESSSNWPMRLVSINQPPGLSIERAGQELSLLATPHVKRWSWQHCTP